MELESKNVALPSKSAFPLQWNPWYLSPATTVSQPSTPQYSTLQLCDNSPNIPPPIDYNRGTDTQLVGQWSHSVKIDGKLVKWRQEGNWMSNKVRNRRIKMQNGNRDSRNLLKIYHWNMGSSLWVNKKVEIDALILEKNPDLFFISEYNLYDSVPIFARHIEGY